MSVMLFPPLREDFSAQGSETGMRAGSGKNN